MQKHYFIHFWKLFQLQLFKTSHATSVCDGTIFNRRKREYRHNNNNKNNVTSRSQVVVNDLILGLKNGKSVRLNNNVNTAAVTHNKVMEQRIWAT